MTTKIKVRGTSKHPIYKWLTSRELNGMDNYKISWNFNKFLIDEEGKLLAHFSSSVKPYDDKILKHLD
jgi:glutathione peroxidase